MGIRKRRRIRFRQRLKRRHERRKLRQQGLNPDDFYYGRYYVRSYKK